MYNTLRTFRSTITFPASGSGWATAKPWEAFAAGTIMFFHPEYDTQGHIMPIRGKHHWTDEGGIIPRDQLQMLSDFLRVPDVETFRERVQNISRSDYLWHTYADLQRRYYEAAFMYWRGGSRRIEEVLGL